MQKLLSVLMSVYNGEKFIEPTIQSVLNQTYSDFDFVIVDDGSTDNSRKIVQQYEQKDLRIKGIYLDENTGFSGALNLGLAKINTQWVARIDEDDIWYATKLEKQMSFLQKNEGYALVASWMNYIDKNGNIIGESREDYIVWEKVEKRYKQNKTVVFCHSSIVFDRNLVVNIGGYRKQFWPCEDADLWNRILECGKKMVIYPEILTAYRIHGESISVARLHEMNSQFRYVKFCMKERRSGKSEPTYEEYMAINQKQKLIKRINNYRKDFSKYYYKVGVFAYSNKQYLKFIYNLLLSSILNPTRMMSLMLKKKVK
jgi:glycosyltransferase involved in cell wall biosynthesis